MKHKPVTGMSPPWKRLLFIVLGLFLLTLYNEWIVYYVTLLQCQWPQLDLETTDYTMEDPSSEPLRAMVLADTHLLGTKEGHWFDKLRREWQMERAFQSAMLIHNPEQVFILGDLFDEGKWCSDQEFQYYVTRFRRMFATPDKTNLQVVVGNHDIGFHYVADEKKLRRFNNAFDAPSVHMLHVKENAFVLLNSVAFEGDRCSMCREAEKQLSEVLHSLDCASKKGSCNQSSHRFEYSRPIILQHFPLYRESDSNCSGADSALGREKYATMRPRWDCLAKDVSEKLLETVRPRLVISGHTHHFCVTSHANKTPEWTVPSFSWRYKNNPSFLLLVVSRNNFAISKCYLPQESTVIRTYIIGAIIIVLGNIFRGRKIPFYNRTTAKLN